MIVTVYSKPACVQCVATYRALDKQGITYQVVDLTEDAVALQRCAIWATSRPPSWWPARTTGRASVRTRSARWPEAGDRCQPGWRQRPQAACFCQAGKSGRQAGSLTRPRSVLFPAAYQAISRTRNPQPWARSSFFHQLRQYPALR